MKNQISWMRNAGLGLLLILPLAAGCLQRVSTPAEQVSEELDPEAATQTAASDPLETFEPAPSGDISHAQVRPVSDDISVPSNLHVTPALVDFIDLASSGAKPALMLAFITNSTDAFSLGPEEIIYLNDIGVPAQLITEMLRHDHILQSLPVPTAAPEPPSQWELPAAESDFAGGNATPNPVNYVDDANSYATPQVPQEQATTPAFYDSLAPYGSWVDVDGYGRCWQPSVVAENRSWQPYFDGGNWVYTDSGWYWMSDYSWGWAPFHYGRWFRHDRLGWCWAPDNVWGPSWVCWRYTDDYCGWAPLPPTCGFTFAGGLTFLGKPCLPDCNFGLGLGCFRFVATHDICRDHVSRHAVPREHLPRFYHHTIASTAIFCSNNGAIVNEGVGRHRIVAALGHEIMPVTLRPVHSAGATTPARDRFEGNGRTLAVYRPQTLNAFISAGDSTAKPVSSRSRQPSPSAPVQTTVSQSSTVTRIGHSAPQEAAMVMPGRVPPLILRGPDRPITHTAKPAAESSTHGTHRTDPAQSAGHLAWGGRQSPEQNLQPEPAQAHGHSSLVVIGRRGGSAPTADHSQIRVFTTGAPAIHSVNDSQTITYNQHPWPPNNSEQTYASRGGANRGRPDDSGLPMPSQHERDQSAPTAPLYQSSAHYATTPNHPSHAESHTRSDAPPSHHEAPAPAPVPVSPPRTESHAAAPSHAESQPAHSSSSSASDHSSSGRR